MCYKLGVIKIYIHGCNCGQKGSWVKRVQRYGEENGIQVLVFNSKYSQADADFHMSLLLENDLPSDSYTPIIIDEYGNVSELRTWRPN